MRQLIFLLFSSVLTAKDVKLTWADAINPAATTYNVYRAGGSCDSPPAFTKIASALPVKAYTDANITTGTYCYYVTAELAGLESLPSPTAGAQVTPAAPGTITVTVTVTVNVP